MFNCDLYGSEQFFFLPFYTIAGTINICFKWKYVNFLGNSVRTVNLIKEKKMKSITNEIYIIFSVPRIILDSKQNNSICSLEIQKHHTWYSDFQTHKHFGELRGCKIFLVFDECKSKPLNTRNPCAFLEFVTIAGDLFSYTFPL